nr:MAG TPA: hypothetical protein [Caudoviricetes sp.]
MMAEDKKILEAPKKVVDGLVEVFEGLAQMFSGVSDQLEKIPLLAADPEDEIPRPLGVAPALSEKKGAATPHPRKKPVKKIRKEDAPVEESAEVPVTDEPAAEDDVNSESSLEQPATESDSAENDSADGEAVDSDFPVDDADALPWNEDTGQKDTAPAEAEPKVAPAVTITKDDITAVIVGKIKKKRSNNEKIGQLLKAYGCKELSALPPEKYEAFLTDISQL